MIRFSVAFLALVFWASTVFAGPTDAFGKALVAKIKSEGYRIESVRTTWLRRVEIESQNTRNRRQTVYNPATSVLLQDVIIPINQGDLMTKVSEMFGFDLRGARAGREGGKKVITSAQPTSGSGGSSGTSGRGNSGRGNSDKGNSGKGNSGKDNPGKGNSGKGNPGKGKNN